MATAERAEWEERVQSSATFSDERAALADRRLSASSGLGSEALGESGVGFLQTGEEIEDWATGEAARIEASTRHAPHFGKDARDILL